MFENILLAVDLDGTLLDDDSRVPEKNLAAIREFRENGGKFTIATGRAISYTRDIANELGIDIPTVVYNGGMIYDFNNEKVLWQVGLPESSREYIEMFREKFPTLAVDVMKGEDIYILTSNYQSKVHKKSIGVPTIRCDMDGLPEGNWDKILLIDELDAVDSLVEYSSRLGLDDVHMTRSSPYFFEILPKDTNKGNALRKMIELCGYDNHFLVSAGDFNNDIEMLMEADHSFAVENAQDEVKEYANSIICDNNSGAIYEIIEFLKKNPPQTIKL